MACQYGHYFLSRGVKPGELVAFYLQNCAEFPIVWLGLWSIGCAPAMINYNLSGKTLLHCLKVSNARIILADEIPECANRINEELNSINDELKMEAITLTQALKTHVASFPAAIPDQSLRRGIKADFPACLFYTSGTTGLPKASAYTMGRMNGSFIRVMGDKPGGKDRWYVCMPLYHGTGGVCLMACLMSGVSVAVGKKFSVTNFWKDVVDSESTFFVYVGETIRYLMAAPPSPLDRQHKVRCIYGNGLRPDVWEKFRERFNVTQISEFFNSTEGVFGLLNQNRGPFQATCVGYHGAILRRMLNDVYVPVEHDSVTGDIIRDPTTGFATRLPHSEGGEIIVAIPDESTFQGYWRNPEATSKKFIRDVFKKGDLYYRTGDALRRADDGHWYFLDRLGDTFRWKSENVSTAEVAAIIGAYPGVLEANVYGVLVPSHDGRAGCAALLIDPKARGQFDWAGFARYARERLPRYAVPVFIRVVESSAHIHNNKQNKVPLRDEGIDPAKKGTKVADGGADRMLWLEPGGNSYVDFAQEHWNKLERREARL